jgi:glycosyltransferase involved in cell wall biosynthesis
MTLLLASGTPHLPQLVGGTEINTHQMALELNRRGHRTAVLSKLSLRDLFGATRFLASRARFSAVSHDRALGYDVYRSLRPWKDIRGLALPKVVVVQNGNMVGIARTFAGKGVGSVAYLHGTEFDTGPRAWKDAAKDLPFSSYIANSAYTAARFKAKFGLGSTVIPPIFPPELYRTPGNGAHVTFINPVPVKGVELALAVARLCPDIPFMFVRAWPIPVMEERQLQKRIAELGNVRLVGRSRDMREIYTQTRLLLVPSQWDETWGRVASEAQFSGIPVLASDSGGLPEAVGPGGLLLRRDDPVELWAENLRALWNDAGLYAEKREAAFSHAGRAQLDISHQMEQLIAITENAAA